MQAVARGLALLVLCWAVLAAQSGIALAEHRVALIIGNGKYAFGAPLPNVPNDADAMGERFKAAGFEAVQVLHNLGKADLRVAIRNLSEQAAQADVVVLYYAGHGLEIGQANYLIPVDAHLVTDFDVEDETLSLERALLAMAPARRLRLVILDACRESPFLTSMRTTVATRSLGGGLARMEPAAPNTLIAFATRPSAIASDGKGPHSPFTAALLKHLLTPGLDLRIALGHVRDEVLASTGRKQEPYVTSSLGGGTIALVPGPAASSEAERAWVAVKDTGSIGQLEVIARRFEGTVYADLARARIDELREPGRAPNGPVVPPSFKAMPSPPPSTPPISAQAERWLASGQKHLEQGNVSAARGFFQRAADAGSAEAALVLGATYDPGELTKLRLGLFGVAPDRLEARRWYERARELGSAEAIARLGRLGAY